MTSRPPISVSPPTDDAADAPADAAAPPGGDAAAVGAAVQSALAGRDTSRWPEKLPVRRRLAVLLDPGSWVEDGLLANARTDGFPADGVVTGVGSVGGRRVAVIAHDYAVKAGSWGELSCEKQIRILERADRDLLPVFYLVDAAGGRLSDQMGFFPGRRGAARIFHLQVRLSGRVPQICCLLGPSAAGGAYMPAFTDWVGMVEGRGSMYLASPRVAEMVTGEVTTLEEMGGAVMHATVSGCGDEVFGEDWEAIAAARLLFGYLPAAWNLTAPPAASVPPEKLDWPEDLIPADPNVAYDIDEVILRLVDEGSFFEIKPGWATEIVTGLARLDGRVVGLVANQPSVRSGAIFVDSADKAARFITLCDAFNVPLVFLQDVPGFMVGVAVERQGIIRHGAKMLTAMASAEVPRLTVVLRKAYAAGFYAMGAPGFEPRATIALPSASIGTMSAEASTNAMYAGKLAEIADDAEREEWLAARVAEQRAEINLLRMASDLVVDAVVEPCDLRSELIARLADADGWERSPQRRHHAVSPV
jgi:acetyl-CoA carboxylase carboxyltransferase component